jgi:hypothetical protein
VPDTRGTSRHPRDSRNPGKPARYRRKPTPTGGQGHRAGGNQGSVQGPAHVQGRTIRLRQGTHRHGGRNPDTDSSEASKDTTPPEVRAASKPSIPRLDHSSSSSRPRTPKPRGPRGKRRRHPSRRRQPRPGWSTYRTFPGCRRSPRPRNPPTRKRRRSVHMQARVIHRHGAGGPRRPYPRPCPSRNHRPPTRNPPTPRRRRPWEWPSPWKERAPQGNFRGRRPAKGGQKQARVIHQHLAVRDQGGVVADHERFRAVQQRHGTR